MKFYWSKEKCGETVLVITEYDLHLIIQKVCTEHFFGGKSTFGDNFEEVVSFLREKKERALWGGMSGQIIEKAKEQKLSIPFTHVKTSDLKKIFIEKQNQKRG